MDIISHGIIGYIVGEIKKKPEKQILLSFFAIAPDFPQFLLYPYLGFIKNRHYFIPENNDWIGLIENHPVISHIYQIPHSLLFLIFIITPIVLYLKLPKLCIAAYFSHIFIDVFTHTGEWKTQIFYPSKLSFNGFTDAWAWSFQYFLLSWIILISILLTTRWIKKLYSN